MNQFTNQLIARSEKKFRGHRVKEVVSMKHQGLLDIFFGQQWEIVQRFCHRLVKTDRFHVFFPPGA